DADGNDLSEEALSEMGDHSDNEALWGELEDSTWIRDGSQDAPRTVYMLMDANCPYCHQFWETARPWVDAGRVQMRHVMVAILTPESLPKAASILAADDPAEKLLESEKQYEKGEGGGAEAMDNPPDDIVRKIGANTDFMQDQGFYATPTIVYKNDDGRVKVVQGVPQEAALEEVMGSPR